MMRFVSNRLAAIRDGIESWGIRLPVASRLRMPRIRVYLDMAHEGRPDVLVGTLSQEDGQYVFRYDPEFTRRPGARPISAFPDLQEEAYRDSVLWPFFAARLPPMEREDVKAELAKFHIRPDETIRLLGTLSKKTITNPYRLELAEAA